MSVLPVLISALLPIPISAILLLLTTLIEDMPVLLTSISDWGAEVVPTPIFAGKPTTYNEFVIVATPIEVNPALTELKLMDPVDDKLSAVVAVPVRSPTNLAAVTVPEIPIFDGKYAVLIVPEVILDAFNAVNPAPEPEKDDAVIIPDSRILDGKNDVLKVPDVILEAFKNAKFCPLPLNETAVTIPFEYTFPDELIPIPVGKTKGLGPTCNEKVGLVVLIPTFRVE